MVKKKKKSTCSAQDFSGYLGQEDPLEKGMAIHANILGWKIPWTEESGRLQSLELERVGHD